MPKQSTGQKKTMERVMHEFKHGELESGGGQKVKSRKQAIAIGLSESGASNRNSKAENKKNLTKTKKKEAKGKTTMQEKEGKGAMKKLETSKRAKSKKPSPKPAAKKSAAKRSSRSARKKS